MRTYTFVTRWRLDAPREDVWGVLADPALSWPTWWPGLAGRVLALGPAPDAHVGSRASLRYRTPLGFGLRIELVLVAAHAPAAASFDVTGDLVGRGDVRLDALGDARTGVTVRWSVATTRWWMSGFAPVAGRVFAWSHAHVMRRGERGLAAVLGASRGTPWVSRDRPEGHERSVPPWPAR